MLEQAFQSIFFRITVELYIKKISAMQEPKTTEAS